MTEAKTGKPIEEETAERQPRADDLSDIGERLRTQDNRYTKWPMFCLQIKVRDCGYHSDYAQGKVWFDEEGMEVAPKTKGAQKAGYRDRWETVMVAFTEQGLKDYMRQDGHNVKALAHNGETRIYVESFRRCEEMIRIRRFLMQNANDVGWQPIETAPKDGTEILGYRKEYGQLIVRYCATGRCMVEGIVWDWWNDNKGWLREKPPTHWHALPDDPEETEG